MGNPKRITYNACIDIIFLSHAKKTVWTFPMQVESMQEVFPDRNPDDSPDQMTLGANLGDDDISRQSTLVLSPSATDGVNVGFLVVNNTNPFTNQMVIPSGIPFPTASACHVAPGND